MPAPVNKENSVLRFIEVRSYLLGLLAGWVEHYNADYFRHVS